MNKELSLVDSLRFGFKQSFQNIGFFVKTYIMLIPFVLVTMVLPLLALGTPIMLNVGKFVAEFMKLNKVEVQDIDYFALGVFVKQKIVSSGILPWIVIAAGIAMFLFIFGLIYLMFGLIRLGFNIIDGNPNRLRAFFIEQKFFGRIALLAVFSSIFVVVHTIFSSYFGMLGVNLTLSQVTPSSLILSCLLRIPYFIFMTIYGYYGYLIVDENVGIIEGLKQSARITYGARLKLFGYYVAYEILSFIILFLSPHIYFLLSFVFLPVILLTSIHMYRSLKEQTEKNLAISE